MSIVMLFAMVACGCREENREEMTNGVVPSAAPALTNVMKAVKRILTPEQQKAAIMRDYLDGGDIREALVRARDLMDASDPAVRSEVVGVFDWIGKRAMPELAEMVSDQDSEIAAEALCAWNRACEELRFEEVRAVEIAKIVGRLRDPALIDSILMNMTDFRFDLALRTLDGIIVANRGKVASSCAKEMYEHLSGEPWDSTARTQAIIVSTKDKKSNKEGK